ncbi:adenylate kinase [Helicobacter ailurogastricus]|uniref:Adenylate kinase n=1 Tax=Helicobacter ailurogastricus TaxID=1578720 RepID=A0A0K2X7R8_9HELI|nr:adenylate kinase [Helicobacter ailurogastricus]CRF41285.1 Adenylate kinase [Helicobacter ailurogastricus]CRF42557.1 Adenylate kinase [Helicobacter ailurogastricus]CRF44577.1 Adenylate kinase [Helicobacter ailurogastricus]CRF51912.1 Adenylate kinase [Helicobacter ailurogastricus]BDQ29018.1 adenylate kinase [Helicobacter ailurogastricus]
MKALFLIIGAPGSGKTTDAQLIAERNSDCMVHYSTGDLLRAEIAKQSERGQLIASFTSKGELVPLEIVIDTIITAIKNAPKEVIIIDGYPRSVEQMNALDRVLKAQEEVKLKGVVEVHVSEVVARERVLGRSRGDDDNIEVFNNRMQVYLKPLESIVEFYKALEVHQQINGERSIEAIVADIEAYIKTHIKDKNGLVKN